jgi:DNA-binding MarR family transcriptional regulator
MKSIIEDLNKAFENKVRLGVMSVLVVNEFKDFNSLKELLQVTDGNLSSHIKALEKLAYVEIEKKFVDRKPRTEYRVTEEGRQAFKKHIEAIEKLLS